MAAKAPVAKPSASGGQNPVWGDDPAYSVAAAAGYIGISAKTLYAHIAARRLDSFKLFGKVMVRRSALLELVKQSLQKAI